MTRTASASSAETPLEGLAQLSRALGGMLASLLRRGWQFPFRFVAVAQNGACMSGRVDRGCGDGVDPIWDVEEVPDEGLQLPIHVMWLHSEGGDAAYMQVDRTGATKFLN